MVFVLLDEIDLTGKEKHQNGKIGLEASMNMVKVCQLSPKGT